jgi:hypothetical protein
MLCPSDVDTDVADAAQGAGGYGRRGAPRGCLKNKGALSQPSRPVQKTCKMGWIERICGHL